MIENSQTGMQAIARSENLAAWARLTQLIGIPAGLAFMGWLGLSMVAIGNDISAIKQGAIDNDRRLASAEAKIDRLEQARFNWTR